MIKLFENYNQIAEICNRYAIENWSLNGDGGIDVDGDVGLEELNLTKLPIKFGRVTGSFDCSYNKLPTLEGAPNWVGGLFLL